MSTALSALLIFIGIGIAVWLISFIVEALRPVPKEPRTLAWAPDIPIEHLEVGGNRLRYIKSGKGPVLVLLHTLRTQLDLFEKVIPELSKHFIGLRAGLSGSRLFRHSKRALRRRLLYQCG